MLVKDFMVPAKDVVKCAPSDSIETVVDKILENRISAVVVVDGDQAVGIVTKTDTTRAYKQGIQLSASVEEIMSTGLHTVQSDLPRDKAAAIFKEQKIHHAVVVSDGFVGFISAWDIAKECVLDDKAWPYFRSGVPLSKPS